MVQVASFPAVSGTRDALHRLVDALDETKLDAALDMLHLDLDLARRVPPEV